MAGALAGLGHHVEIWNQHSLESTGPQKAAGEVCGARFEYVLGTTERQYGFRAAGDKLRAVWIIRRKLIRACREGRADVVMFNHLAFYDTFPITLVARRHRVPTVQCYEDERMELVSQLRVGLAQRLFGFNSWLADRWCSPMADGIVVISSYLKEKYTRLSRHPERVHVVPTIIDCQEWDFGEERPAEPPVILYSGGFGEHEDLDKLVDALAILQQRGVPFRMKFLGADPKYPRVGAVRARIRDLGLDSAVEMKGFSARSVVKEEVALAHVLMNLRTNSVWSRSGLSTKLSEYLASGRLVITTDIGDNARYVRHEESALVTSPDAPAFDVAALLERAIRDPGLRKRVGRGGRKAALAHFDVPVVQSQLQAILSALRKRA
jgi:glycosyltransferase involved in cell wall biosynthesis